MLSEEDLVPPLCDQRDWLRFCVHAYGSQCNRLIAESIFLIIDSMEHLYVRCHVCHFGFFKLIFLPGRRLVVCDWLYSAGIFITICAVYLHGRNNAALAKTGVMLSHDIIMKPLVLFVSVLCLSVCLGKNAWQWITCTNNWRTHSQSVSDNPFVQFHCKAALGSNLLGCWAMPNCSMLCRLY